MGDGTTMMITCGKEGWVTMRWVGWTGDAKSSDRGD